MNASPTQNSQPNIVLIVADDHGRESLGCYGNTVINTPHLDALAADGVYFTNSFCTTASCAASRSVILTGMQNHTNGTYGHTHGAHHFSLLPDVPTLPAMIKQAGYRTGRVGKKHFAPDSQYPFDWGYPEDEFGRDDIRMAESCREFVSSGQPFFLYYCSKNPHRAGFVEDHPLRPNDFGNPAESFPGDQEQPYDEDQVIVPPFLPDTPEVRAELAQYYQSIARLDRGIGRLMDILTQQGVYDNTVIIYISDNGAAFPQSKTTLYDPGMRLPCIVRSPLHTGNHGGACDALITWADITPTILDLAGWSGDTDRFFGNSIAPVLDHSSPNDWRDEIYAAHTFHEITNYYPMRVVRTKRYKCIYNIAWKLDYSFASDLWMSPSWQAALRDNCEDFGCRSIDAYIHRPCCELYDLQEDPNETVNLAYDPDYADIVEQLTGKIKAFQERTNDPWVHKWTYE